LKKPSSQSTNQVIQKNITMSPSTYQTVPFADPSKVEPSSTPVSLWKKVGVAAMVGAALVAGNSYGSNNNNTNSAMNEIDAFLSVMEDTAALGTCPFVKNVGAPSSCPRAGEVLWSVAGITDDANCFGGTIGRAEICGEICVLSAFIKVALPFAPFPKPERGSCASRGFTVDTKQNFSLKAATTADYYPFGPIDKPAFIWIK